MDYKSTNKPSLPSWVILSIVLFIIILFVIIGVISYFVFKPSKAVLPDNLVSLSGERENGVVNTDISPATTREPNQNNDGLSNIRDSQINTTDLISSFINQKVDVMNHNAYLRTLQDPDQDKDGLSDIAESLIYKTDPRKYDSSGTGIGDGQYIYNLYKEAFETSDESALIAYRSNFAQYKHLISSSTKAAEFLRIASVEEIFNMRALQTYNLYVGLSDELKRVVIQALDARQNGDYKKSLDLLQSLLLTYPDSAVLKYHLGLTFHGMKQYEKAISIYESIIDNPTLKSPLLYSDIASAYIAIGNGYKFVEYMRKSMKEFPEDLNQYTKLAAYYQDMNQLDNAVAVLNEGLKIEPRYGDYYNMLAIIAHLRGDAKRELALYQKAVSYDFRYAPAHVNISIIYEEVNNDLEGALVEALIAMEIDPTPFRVSRVVTLYSSLGQNVLSQRYENELLGMKDIDAASYNSLGLKYMDANNYQKAETYLRKAIATDPTLPNPYNNLGIVLASTNRQDEAGTSYKKAIDLNPNYANAYSNLGIYYTDKKQYSQAIESFNTASRLNPNLWRPYQGIAYVYRMLNDIPNEKLYYEKAVRYGCNDPVVIERLKVLSQ